MHGSTSVAEMSSVVQLKFIAFGLGNVMMNFALKMHGAKVLWAAHNGFSMALLQKPQFENCVFKSPVLLVD